MKPALHVLCLFAVVVISLAGCSSVQINSGYKKSPLPGNIYIAPGSNMIFKIDTVPDTFNTMTQVRDREEENRIRLKIEEFLSKADTRFTFLFLGNKVTDDENKQVIFDVISGIIKSGVEGYTVPDAYRKYFSNRKARFAVVICHNGFFRTERNAKSMAKAAVVTSVASLGTVMLVYKAASSNFQYCVIDTENMRVVLYDAREAVADPRSEKVLLEHLYRLVRDLTDLGT